MSSENESLSAALNRWWLILGIWGIVNCTVWAPEWYFYPIGIGIAGSSFISYFGKKNTVKVAGALTCMLIIIAGISAGWKSTSSIYVGYITFAVLTYYLGKKRGVGKKTTVCIAAVPAICDIYAGLNKLLPSSGFWRGQILEYVLNNNLVIEPSWLVTVTKAMAPVIALSEIIIGICLIVKPRVGYWLLILIHIPIGLLSGETYGHVIHLLMYASALIFAAYINYEFIGKKSGWKENIATLYIRRIKRLLNSRAIDIWDINLFIQISLPGILMLGRILTGKIYMYGFGWQMYSQPIL